MSKKFLLLTLLVPLITNAQQYALIDKKLKLPIIFTDSVTVEQVNKGFFPVENTSIDTFIANLNYISGLLDKRQRSKMKSFELKSSNTSIKIGRFPFAYGDRYAIEAHSKCGEVTALLRLTNTNDSNKDSGKKLEQLLRYLKSNQSFYKEPNEIQPKIYNVIVTTD